jgi:ABC-type spermidine/putrescine transport system permease subunit II
MHASLFNIGLAHVVITLPFAMRVVIANLQTVSVSWRKRRTCSAPARSRASSA